MISKEEYQNRLAENHKKGKKGAPSGRVRREVVMSLWKDKQHAPGEPILFPRYFLHTHILQYYKLDGGRPVGGWGGGGFSSGDMSTVRSVPGMVILAIEKDRDYLSDGNLRNWDVGKNDEILPKQPEK